MLYTDVNPLYKNMLYFPYLPYLLALIGLEKGTIV